MYLVNVNFGYCLNRLGKEGRQKEKAVRGG